MSFEFGLATPENKHYRLSSLSAGRAEFRGYCSNPGRGFENLPHSEPTDELMATHGRQGHRAKTTAARAVRLAAELARSDFGFQVGRKWQRRSCEDALFRRLRRAGKLPDRVFSHVQLRELLTQPEQLLNGSLALLEREAFGGIVCLLGRKHAHPDLLNLPPG